MPKPIQANLLGTPQVIFPDGEVALFHNDNSLSLMIILASKPGKIFTRAEVATLLYPDSEEKQASQNLRQVIHRLRKLVKADDDDFSGLQITASTLSLNDPDRIITDLQLIEMKFARLQWFTKDHHHRDPAICNACASYHLDLVDLFPNTHYFDFDSQIDIWIPYLRQQIKNNLLDSLRWLAEFHYRRQKHDLCENYLERIARIDPYDETVIRTRMKLLAGRRQVNQALILYYQYQQSLFDSMELSPEDETVEIAHAIRSGTWQAPDATSEAYFHIQPDQINNATADITLPFSGRAAELERLRNALDDAGQRLIILQGPLGCGKSRLMIEACARDLPVWQDGVYYLSFGEQVPTNTVLVPALIRALKIPSENSSEHRQNLIRSLREKECVILLDDLDLVTSPIDVLQTLLHNCPKIKFMVTTKKKLDLHGGAVLAVDGLAYDGPNAEDGTETQNEACELLKIMIQRIDPSFDPNGVNLRAMAEICQLTRGYPRGLELVALTQPRLGLQKIIEQIKHPLVKRADISAHVPDRFKYIQRYYQNTWSSLSELQRVIVRRVAEAATPLNATGLGNEFQRGSSDQRFLKEASILLPLAEDIVDIHPILRLFLSELV